jgi:hypothetical protein
MEILKNKFILESNQSLLNFLTVFNTLNMLKDSMNNDEILDYMDDIIDIWSNSYKSHFYKLIEKEKDKDYSEISKKFIDNNLEIVKKDMENSIKNTLKIFINS